MKFRLGQVVITRPALSFCEKHQVDVFGLLRRHSNGDWGDLTEDDKRANDAGLGSDERIFSSYSTPHGKVWVITEWNREVTTILLPEDY